MSFGPTWRCLNPLARTVAYDRRRFARLVRITIENFDLRLRDVAKIDTFEAPAEAADLHGAERCRRLEDEDVRADFRFARNTQLDLDFTKLQNRGEYVAINVVLRDPLVSFMSGPPGDSFSGMHVSTSEPRPRNPDDAKSPFLVDPQKVLRNIDGVEPVLPREYPSSAVFACRIFDDPGNDCFIPFNVGVFVQDSARSPRYSVPLIIDPKVKNCG
ncbi:MAG: hypothetical protein ABW194_09960 [Novosphingobium sp.]